MSPLLRDELRVVLCPGEVLVTRISRAMTLRGLRRKVVFRKRLICDAAAAGDLPWVPAISRLAEAMQDLADGKVSATAIVSNHFMRYTVVPWSETLTSATEQAAYARHCFRENYGYSTDAWELCLNPGRPRMPRLASAIDSRLLDALRAVFMRSGSPLKSIQPHLMAAYNYCRPALQKIPGWFVLHEPGSLCVALLDDAGCSFVKTSRVGSDWIAELPLLLERESRLAGREPGAAAVHLFAPELGAAAAPSCGGFHMRNLMTTMPAGLVADYVPGTPAAVLS